ncbi:MAG: YfhO family protein [Eubacteriales bacterium]|nr:YfhO family protein [Eubacteriales bacterium]
MSSNRHPLRRTALLCALAGLLSLLPCLVGSQGQLMHYGDYLLQYIPFLRETRRMLLSGSYAWSWNTFLGDSFYGAYSYYTVANPFAYLALLFPDNLLLYGTLAAQLVKFALSGIFSFLYLKRFVRDDTTATIGALLYTFSGFTIINTNYYFFLDVIAVFPLLLLGIELVGEHRSFRSGWILALAVFVNAIVNYYFLISSFFLCAIYVLFRFDLLRRPKGGLSLLGRLFGFSALGAGCGGFLLLPAFWKILHTPKATGSLGSLYLHPYTRDNILERLRIFFMPIDNNILHSFYDAGSWTSTAVYLSVFGALFVLLFVLQNRRHWLTKAMLFLLVFLFVPLLNGVFTLFSDFFYTRWLYGLVLLLDLATVWMLEKRAALPAKMLKKWYGISLLILAVLAVPPAAAAVLHRIGIDTPLNALYPIVASSRFLGLRGIALSFGLTAVNYLLLACILFRPRIRPNTVLALVCLACVCNYAGYLALFHSYHAFEQNLYLHDIQALPVSEQTTFTDRTDYSTDVLNAGLFANTPSVSGYHSLQNENAVAFAVAAGYTDSPTVVSFPRPAEQLSEIDTLLSVRRYVDVSEAAESTAPDGFTLVSEENGVKTYENDNYLPMGFCYDGYLTQEDVERSDLTAAQCMLLGLVVDDRTAQIVSDSIPELDISQISADDFDLTDTANARRAQSSSDFVGTSSGFTASITLDNANYVFFSVPNDDGWRATVNGQEADILTVNYGLCAVRCEAGDNAIVFTYHTPWLMAGCVISALSILLTARLLFFSKRRNAHV